MSTLKRYLVVQDALSEWVGKAISWLVVVIVAVLLYEVFARYLFGSPTSWAHEFSTMLYGAFGVLATAYTQRFDAHVRSDAVYGLFTKRWKTIVDVITALIAIVVFCLFFKLAIDFAVASWVMGEVSYRSTWQPPIYPFKAMLPLGIGLLILQTAARLVRDVCELLGLETNTT